MSNYRAAAWHPIEHRIRTAMWLDDWFGIKHQYGVQFDEGGEVYLPEQVVIPLDRVFEEVPRPAPTSPALGGRGPTDE